MNASGESKHSSETLKSNKKKFKSNNKSLIFIKTFFCKTNNNEKIELEYTTKTSRRTEENTFLHILQDSKPCLEAKEESIMMSKIINAKDRYEVLDCAIQKNVCDIITIVILIILIAK